jgi:16S rRNA (cytosine967-C5)-methyltransferase
MSTSAPHNRAPVRGRGAGTELRGITPARLASTLICADLRNGLLLDLAFERRAAQLEARDRRWVQELVWGMLRSRSRLDAILATRVRGGLSVLDDDVAELLRLGSYQLLSMDSVPPYAAIGETVELTKQRHGIGASKLANAVLRRIDRERAQIEPAVPADVSEALAQRYSHPRWVVDRWRDRFGAEETERLLAANNVAAPIVVRPYALSAAQLADALLAAGVETQPVPLVPDSLRLSAGVALTELGAFKQGHLFVQDPAATLVAQYAHVPLGSTVADLCAAPGSKALELARRAGVVLAADRHLTRVERMLQGFGRLDANRVLSVVADARHPAIAMADAVLVDVPCTGTGTFRRHPDARWRLRISDFAVLGQVQREILRGAATAVRPGGLLIYSTCSLETEENDEMIDAFLVAHPEFALEPPPSGSVPDAVLDQGRLRLLPQMHGHDGAFAARLRRRA